MNNVDAGDTIRQQLLKLSSDLGWLAKADSNPVGALLIEARSKLDQITAGHSLPVEFRRITAAELATQRFDMMYLVEGVLLKDQPAVLVGPKKSLKTNISIDLAVSPTNCSSAGDDARRCEWRGRSGCG